MCSSDLTIVRKYPNVDMVPAMFIAAFLSAMYASFLVNSFYISPKDLLLSFLLGTFQIGFGFICITIGSKNTPAAIVGILMLVEAILGPIWAWIFINETPPLIVIIGDRKSTRLNSSHKPISYADFCLKKKKHKFFFVLSFVFRNSSCSLSASSLTLCFL